MCVNLLSAKLLYERNPELNVIVLLLYRGALTSIILAGFHNVNMKAILYDNVESSYIKPLIIRVISRNLAVFALYWATKYFTLTTCIMVHLCAPFVSICMAGPILGE